MGDTLEDKANNLAIDTELLEKDDYDIKIQNLFKNLSIKLENRLLTLPKTQDGKDNIKIIIDDLKDKIIQIQTADIEMTKVFTDYIKNKNELGINEELKNIYNELFFLQVKLINDTFYEMITTPGTPKEIKPNLNDLFKAFHKKIKSLNEYIKSNNLEKKNI